MIVQPYVPRYRVPFFEGLRAALATSQIDCVIAASELNGSAAERGDAEHPDWMTPIKSRSISVAGRQVKLGGSISSWQTADAVILGSEGTSVDVYRALSRARRGKLRVGLWGHIKDYVNPPNPLDQALERWQLRRADHVFAYTPGGAAYAESVGVPSTHVTTVMNSIDVSDLESAIRTTSDEQVSNFMLRHGLAGSKTLAYIGALDAAKRVSFFAEALEHLWVDAPDVKIIVAGRGSDEGLLEPAVARGQVIMTGYANAATKALIARVASGLLMPGRIGLVAVDALVLKLPILTTAWPFHAPEVEYLEEGFSRLTSADTPRDYSRLLGEFTTGIRRVVGRTELVPEMEQMILNFAGGIKTMLHQAD